jgi:putative ABC transport system permease protein
VTRLYRVLLLLYPAAFRRRYARELLDAFEEERRDPRHAGLDGAAAMWRHLLGDLLVSAARQRWRQISGLAPRGKVPGLPLDTKRSEMDTILQDIGYAARQFARRPGFTAVAVLSLALGIGGSTLIYGLVDGLVLSPFPYPDPGRLVTIGATFPKITSETAYVEAISPAEYADLRGAGSFSAIAAFDLGNRNLAGGEVPERVFTALLLDDPFPVLGMKPVLGRGFTREELGAAAVMQGNTRTSGAAPAITVAIISHRLWRSRFGQDPNILNRSVRIGGNTTSIVGVMPPGLLLIGTDLWIPWGGDPSQMPRNARQFTLIARLAPGVSLARATAELGVTAAQIDSAHRPAFKEYEGWRLSVTPWAEALMQEVRPAAFILLGAVGLVLLIACANLASLFLARATTRRRELAVRRALGAGGWRIARLLLTETLLLAGAGAGAGLLLAYYGLKSAASLVPAQMAMLGLEAGLNGRVLACALALAVAAGLLVGVLPALQAARTDPHESLKADGRAGGGRSGQRVRQALVVAELALSVTLLLGAGLLMRSFLKLQQVDPGFDPKGVLTMRLTLPPEKYASSEAMTTFFEQLIGRVETLPGVSAVALASQFPPSEPFASQVEVEGLTGSGEQLPTTNVTVASKNLFRTLGIPVLAGSGFTGRERAQGVRQVVINEAFALRYLRHRNPIGARVRPAGRGGPGPWAEVIGVVGSSRNVGLDVPGRPEVFTAMEQGRDGWNQLFLLVRSNTEGHAMLPAIRQAIATLDPEQPVYMIQTLEEALAVSSFQKQASTILIGIFAAIALMLAAVGIYGVTSYTVTARIQEMGVRLAVGAQPRDVLWLVLGQVLRLAATGLVIGLALLLAAGKLLTRLLYGVSAADPLTMAAAAAVLGCVAVLAAWALATRASRVDPIEALRCE